MGVYGDLVVGERGQSDPVREARLSSLGTDIRALAVVWRDLAMCPHKRSALQKQVCEERKRDREKDRERETISIQSLKEKHVFINELIC